MRPLGLALLVTVAALVGLASWAGGGQALPIGGRSVAAADPLSVRTIDAGTVNVRGVLTATVVDAGTVVAQFVDAGIVTAGQLTVDTSTLYVDPLNHRLGVGTSAPSQPFTLYKSQNGITHLLVLNDQGGASARANVIASNGTGQVWTGMRGVSETPSGAFLANQGYWFTTGATGGGVAGTVDATDFSLTTNGVARITVDGSLGTATSGYGWKSSVGSGVNGFSCTTNGCRVDLGTGASDYLTSNGTLISTPGAFTAASGLNSNTLFTNTGVALDLRGTAGNGSTAVGISLGTQSAFSSDGARLVSVANNFAEKFNIRLDGATQYTGVATGSLATCDGAHEGAIQYDTTVHKHVGCNGTAWTALY